MTAIDTQLKTEVGQRPRASWQPCRATAKIAIAESSHVGLLDEVHGSDISVDAINDVVQSVRSGLPLAL